MILASHIEEVNGRLFALGAIKPWSERVSRNPRPPRYIRLRSARIGKAKGVYAVPERVARVEVYSLAALLVLACGGDGASHSASLRNALILVQLSNDQVWYALIKDGELQAGSDILHATSTESDREMWRNRLAEAKQLVPEDSVYMFDNVAGLVDGLTGVAGGDLEQQLLQSARLCGSGGMPRKRQLLLGAIGSVVIGAVVAFYLNLQPVHTEERAARLAQARSLYSSAVADYYRTIPSIQGGAFLQRALSVPINKLGADLASISCNYSQCRVIYSTEHARLVSPVIRWAQLLDAQASYDSTSGILSLNFDASIPQSPPAIPHLDPQQAQLVWADLRAALKPLGGITVSATDPAPAPGALDSGETLKTGSWEVASVPFKYALAVIDGLHRAPGAGISYMRLSGEFLTLGGTYAIQ
ncbi:hypothetical protein [Marinobacterium arenosum]|uniref:hypothetical protein n=1 Tax=Marinobacterium arenosum TaxID=2862496 RepID=UPI001C98E181|nr:hypothetical protein [Marinobacterium arenosum]MBY4677952.1 hypothetical protein [Marinobacterium arenosum]